MKSAIAKVKSAVSGSKDIASHLSHYLVKDRMIYASDNRMTAAAPFDFDGTFLVPGHAFEAIADKIGDDAKIVVGEKNVTISSGRLRSTIETLPPDTVDHTMSVGEWIVPPAGFVDALVKIRPFLSDNAVHLWALAVCLGEGMMFGTNNVVVAAATCPGLSGGNRLLPHWAADYVISRDADVLNTMIVTDNFISFLWDDGSWMRSQLIDMKFPEAAESLVSEISFDDRAFTLSDEWKTAYRTAAEFTESLIEIHPDKLVAEMERSKTEYEVATPVSTVSKWNRKFLSPVVDAADRWCPDMWPKPASFSGPGIVGVIVGRK